MKFKIYTKVFYYSDMQELQINLPKLQRRHHHNQVGDYTIYTGWIIWTIIQYKKEGTTFSKVSHIFCRLRRCGWINCRWIRSHTLLAALASRSCIPRTWQNVVRRHLDWSQSCVDSCSLHGIRFRNHRWRAWYQLPGRWNSSRRLWNNKPP